ncbi:MAG: hypothetical protein COC09_03065 [Gammaproteobacteria bacterium]|nr:MAG: hypothetical protein COC09_03065 [Gammaproteobacteria bacterium]
MIIYLDESGDLGWKFNAPYRRGGSSRHITIASLVVSPSKKHLPKRLIKKLYTKFKWPVGIEKKWANMSLAERIWFAEKANELKAKHPGDIRYLSITVKKENVQTHIRADANKLYNYMIGLSLLREMSLHESVTFVPDPRSIKVESGNSLHDYLQTQLWFEKDATTTLATDPYDSASNRNVQFADMISGIVQGHFEDGNSQPWTKLRNNISYKTLFF